MGGSLRPPPGLAGYLPVNDLNALYLEAIKQHAADPTGYRQKIDATHQFEEYNPLCGDRILVQLRITQEQVEAAAFDGEACAICMASASLLCGNTPGQIRSGTSRSFMSACSRPWKVAMTQTESTR